CERNFVVGPCSADSANSVHGNRSLVQKAKGIIHVSCKQTILAPARAAASIIAPTLACSAFFCSSTGAVVGDAMEFWMTATRTFLGGRSCSD
ncbi:unnamed protein product, partial [Haemonchus placei]|uniref:Secreted protein n=1 Tax=Haemonchus placei TaxID=6290 RepID=A0A0N4VXS5_HAEPC